MRANLPPPEFFLGRLVPNRPDILITEHVGKGNDGHVFRGHSKILGRDFACKIIPRSNLQYGPNGEETWRFEIQKADALQNPSVVRFTEIQVWKDELHAIDCVVFLGEFVEGPTLRVFLRNSAPDVTIPFIDAWLRTMLNLFYEMGNRNIKHGDLHAGNILVADTSEYNLLGNRYVFRVTDFGVSEATSEPRFKDDYYQLADILATLLKAVHPESLSPKEKFIFNFLRHSFLPRHLVEQDVTLDSIARRPAALLRRLQELDDDYAESVAGDPASLSSPFDFLSCEQIGDEPELLRALYSDRFLGLPAIESRNNVVLTGPRGCGKTTVFRNLSLDQRMRIGEAAPNKIQYIGVYYICLDLYFAFPRYRSPEKEEAIDIPIHFITATLLANLLDVIDRWAREQFTEEFARAENSAAQALWEALGFRIPQDPSGGTLKAVIAALNKQRRKAIERQQFAVDTIREIGKCFGPDVLLNACNALTQTLSFIQQRPIYFFIDDYSMPKVTDALQENLNRVFMQRTSVCFFKISTESPVSFTKKDLDGKVYVEGREFQLHNLGIVYLQSDVDMKLEFLEDVFRRRLRQSQQRVPVLELRDLVGSFEHMNNNEMARDVKADKMPQMWGVQLLCMLCSGDIHYLISLVSEMVQVAGGFEAIKNTNSYPKIASDFQNQAIRRAAGGFLTILRTVPKYGEQLVFIVEAFGNIAHSHMKFLESKNDKNSPPKQATRIEPYESFQLSAPAQALYNELLRYSVFMEDFRGKSRRGHVVPRLYLRRFLIPHFNLTFSTRDSIEVESSDFETFLLRPKVFEEKMRVKDADDAVRFQKRERQRLSDKNQLNLGLKDSSK